MADQPGYTPHPQSIQVQKQQAERNEKSDATAIEILKLAVQANKEVAISARDLADYAEVLWQWTTTDTWPPKVQP
ncbi:MAG: hypothetical protein ABL907_22230 [Hyphomicrobium sp.]